MELLFNSINKTITNDFILIISQKYNIPLKDLKNEWKKWINKQKPYVPLDLPDLNRVELKKATTNNVYKKKYNVIVLKKMCLIRGLKVVGTKEDLIVKLLNHGRLLGNEQIDTVEKEIIFENDIVEKQEGIEYY
jgi:hypothetical protein